MSEVAQSCPTLCNPIDCSPPAPPSMDFSRQEYWSGLSSVPGLGRSPGEGNWLATPVFWPGEFHGLYSPSSHRVGHD